MTDVALLSQDQLAARSEEDLDWALMLDRLAGFTSSDAGGRRLRELRPADTWEAAQASMARTSEVLSLSDEGTGLPVDAVPDLGDLLDRLERSVVATGTELRDLSRMLESGQKLRVFAQAQKLKRPHLAEHLFSNPALDKLLERLRNAIDADGSVADRASPALERARTKVKELRQELIAQLKRLLHIHADLLQDSYFSEREGRYVLPVRADAHRGIEGTVLDTSASGNTLFVEPRELTGQSNRLRMAISEVSHEEQRILRELSGAARAVVAHLRVAENACIEADVLSALSRFAQKHNARAIIPEPTQSMRLLLARHPLLASQLSEVVANDLELRSGSVLVISGPNAGGKTVSLKAFGLFALMARAGLPLTVEAESSIGFFPQIYSEIGDSQSIVKSLSTFSAHVLTLASILESSRAGALVLLDEVAGGTDPEQGAALSIAYLEALANKAVTVVCTTHYEALKELGSQRDEFHNAAVGFDVSTLSPTFRLLPDVAGPSTALAVAKRYGIPDAVVARATALIPEASRDREALLEQISAERTNAQSLVRQAERDASEQRRLRLEIEKERDELRTNFQRQLEQEYRELLGQVRVARTELEQLRKRLPKDELESLLDDTWGSVSSRSRPRRGCARHLPR
ncbi:MAG: endonuclease MutS2 [Polyangiaceae bacterium]